MAQLLGIAVANPDGRNLKRELEKEDIKVPDKITTHNLMNAIDESVFKKNKKPKKTHDKGDHTTGPPTKPPTTDGHGSSGHHTEKQPTTKPPKDKDKDKDK